MSETLCWTVTAVSLVGFALLYAAYLLELRRSKR